jgi:hypothetical protein
MNTGEYIMIDALNLTDNCKVQGTFLCNGEIAYYKIKTFRYGSTPGTGSHSSQRKISLKLFCVSAEICFNKRKVIQVKERVKPMNINGVYGNGSLLVQESAASPVQKEETSNQVAKNNTAAETMPAVNDTGYVTYAQEDLQNKTEEKNKEEKNMEEDSSEDKQQENISDRMTEEDYKSIHDEGISIEKYDKERLVRALDRVKDQRADKESDIIKQKEILDEKAEAIQNMAGYGTGAEKIIQKLIETGLPVTDANIAKIATAMELAASAYNLPDKSMIYLIKNNLDPTIENLYKAQYSGSFSEKKELPEQVLNNLLGQVNEIIEKAGLVPDKETLESAKWLLNNQLPLIEDTLWAYRDLKQLKDKADETAILDKAVKAIAAGKNPETASLGTVDIYRAGEAITAFSEISEEAVKAVVKNHDLNQVNLKVLQKAQDQLNNKASKQYREPSEAEDVLKEVNADDSSEVDIKTITVRRQLEEIRLKMTLYSGQQLIKRGFRLDTDALSKLVDGLKNIEDRYYKNLLKEGNAEVNGENTQNLKNSLEGIKELKSIPSYILGRTLPGHNLETVNSLISAGTELQNNLNKAGEAYETLMTKPRSDMGDSITKAFRNVDAILEDMKLENTQANERAVRILGYNGMNITEENIQAVKSYDEQVNQLMKNFHPAVAVELIKKGINPLNMPIEELNQQIEGIQSELGITEDEKYSKYLWKLEKSKNITEDEKKSYLGIYRLLNTVEKTDGAALGSVLKADQEVTMQNLLTAVRTFKSGGVDTAVDDGFGSLEELSYSRESITDQLNTSFNQSRQTGGPLEIPGKLTEKFNYTNRLLKDIMDEITPDKLNNLGNTKELLNMSAEALKEGLEVTSENTDTDSQYWSQKLVDYQEVMNQSEGALKLLNTYDVPASLPNIQAAKDLLSTDQSFYKQLNRLLKGNSVNDTKKPDAENTVNDTIGIINTDIDNAGLESTNQSSEDLSDISEGLIEALKNPASMKEQYKVLEQDVTKLLNQMYANPVITSQDIATLQRINYGMSFLNSMASKESYEIPLAVGEDITNVNVTVLRNTGESGKVNITFDSKTLGNITVNLSVRDKGVNALITSDNRQGLNEIKNNSQALREAVAGSGIEIKQLNYGIGNKSSDINRYTNYKPDSEAKENEDTETEDVSTGTLYSLAKTFLVHIKQMEQDANNP